MHVAWRILLLAVGVLSGAGIGPRASATREVLTVRPAAEPGEQPSHPAASHRLPLSVGTARPPVGDRAPDGRTTAVLVAPVFALISASGVGGSEPPRTADRRARPTYLQYYPTAPPPRG